MTQIALSIAVLILAAATTCAGASIAACKNPRFSNGLHNVTLKVGDLNRTLQLYVPYVLRDDRKEDFSLGPPDKPLPALISFHGCNDHYPILDYHEEVTNTIGAIRDRTSALSPWYAILPLGTQEPSLLGSGWGWNSHGIPCGSFEVNDTAFAEAILDFAENELCVDTSKVFMAGFSTGGFLALGLGCKYAGTRVAGVAADAGSLGLLYLEECRKGRPLPIVNFHSKADPTIPYNVGLAESQP